jgi:hypothetical protein
MDKVTKVFTACAVALLWIGCGGDDTAPGGSAGSGGGGGSTGQDASSMEDAATDAPMSIMCGTATCPARTLPFIGLVPPCCPAGEENTCGAIPPGMGCATTSMGTMDPSCPQRTVNGFPAAGCCAAVGICGATLAAIGLGCNVIPMGDAAGAHCGAESGASASDDSGEAGP